MALLLPRGTLLWPCCSWGERPVPRGGQSWWEEPSPWDLEAWFAQPMDRQWRPAWCLGSAACCTHPGPRTHPCAWHGCALCCGVLPAHPSRDSVPNAVGAVPGAEWGHHVPPRQPLCRAPRSRLPKGSSGFMFAKLCLVKP